MVNKKQGTGRNLIIVYRVKTYSKVSEACYGSEHHYLPTEVTQKVGNVLCSCMILTTLHEQLIIHVVPECNIHDCLVNPQYLDAVM